MVWVAVTEIFHALLAKPAGAASISQPGDSDPVADPMCRDIAADEIDAADDFMPRNNRIFDAGKLRIDHMKVGPANPTRAHLDANFSVAGAGVRAFLHLERRSRRRQHHRMHLFLREQPIRRPA
jgi:hypothetical protein